MYVYKIIEETNDHKIITPIKIFENLEDINTASRELTNMVNMGQLDNYKMELLDIEKIRNFNTYELINNMSFDDFLNLIEYIMNKK